MKFSTAVSASIALALAELALAQAPVYGQCGGMGWAGATTCASGSVCTVSNAYYSQCLPGKAASSTVPPATSTVPPATTTVPPASTTSVPVATSSSAPASACASPVSTIAGFNNALLPNPFIFNDGSAVQTKDDWACRRAEIAALVQGYEAGTLPPAPSTFSSNFTLSGTKGTISFTAGNAGKTISFSSTITYPSGTAPSGGWPLVIAYEGGSIPIPSGVATLSYTNSNMAQQNNNSSRGIGTFYNLYGANHSASAMTAWVWGVSRTIDALEQQNAAAKINLNALAVTGCSRDGKGALMAGAFEERIALTIPQESGSGGDTAWRISAYESAQGSVVQTAVEIVTENVWFSSNFPNYVNNLSVLPYDHHSLMAMVAPRALISFENTDYVWLSPMSSYGANTAAQTVFEALGVPENFGFAQVGNHSHCAWPSSLTPALDAFFNKFLLGQNVSTTEFSSNMLFNNITWTESKWINWTPPTLT